MAQHLPYHISQVYLHESLAPPVLDANLQGNYLILWWKDIALGDLYLKPGFIPSETEYQNLLIKAIMPAIDFYSHKFGNKADEWKDWLLDQDNVSWIAWMKKLLFAYSTHDVPDKVPVSVIVCTRDRAQQLRHCLRMLSGLRCRPQEIIVVDNASSSVETEEVVRQHGDVVYVREARPGLDIARNSGLKNAQYPVVAFVDDDVLVHPLWVYRVWESFQDPAVAAMTGLVMAAELATEAQFIFEKHWSFNRGYQDILYDYEFLRASLPKGPPVWEIGAGANMAFRKEVFEHVGFFDELLDVGAAGCSGDSEMWFRLLAQDYTVHYNPRAIVFHEHRKELAGLKKQIFYYMRGHATAALIQQSQHQNAGYRKHLFWRLPKQYIKMIGTGFPHYRYRYKTIWVEMLGVLSGMAFFFKNRLKQSRIIK